MNIHHFVMSLWYNLGLNMKKKLLERCRTYFRFIARKILRDQESLIWFMTSVWSVIMLVLLLLPGNVIPVHVRHNEDKIVHFVLFTVFSALIIVGIRNFKRIFYLTNSSFVLTLGVGCTFVTELAQRWIPGRTVSFFDGLANIAGVFFGIIVTNLIIYYARKSKPQPLSMNAGNPPAIPLQKALLTRAEMRQRFERNTLDHHRSQ